MTSSSRSPRMQVFLNTEGGDWARRGSRAEAGQRGGQDLEQDSDGGITSILGLFSKRQVGSSGV